LGDIFSEFENAETLLVSEVHMLLDHRYSYKQVPLSGKMSLIMTS